MLIRLVDDHYKLTLASKWMRPPKFFLSTLFGHGLLNFQGDLGDELTKMLRQNVMDPLISGTLQ